MPPVRTVLLAVLLSTGAVTPGRARTPPPPGAPAARTGGVKPMDQSRTRVPGYLGVGEVPDTFALLPPPPVPGSHSPADELDRTAYLETRRLQGTPRWALATADAQESAADLAADFDCVLGVDLTPERAPALLHLLTRLRADTAALTTYAKNRFQHPRPFVTYGGPICTEGDRDGVARSWSYPSGHTTLGWSVGLVMAELAPDRAADLLARARAYGESRVVCGVHTVSDVEEGRTNGAAVVAVVHANPQFRADLETARAELAALRARPDAHVPPGRTCAVEREAMARTPWLPVKAAPPARPGAPSR